MTTNIRPIEALKSAFEMCDTFLKLDTVAQKDKFLYQIELVHFVLQQALASQECDVTKCPAYEEHGGEYWQGCWEFNDICQEDGYHCSDKPNCDFKTRQLHSQQKTFTLEEIVKKLTKKFDSNLVSPKSEFITGQYAILKELIQEFEKES